MKIGVVGLGRMGAAISRRLKETGFEVVAWDRRAEANQELSHEIAIANNSKEISERCDVIISIITDDRGVREIFNGENGLLSTNVAGKLFIEMSTLQPMTARELAPVIESKGARLIDSPVLGTIPQVREGKLFALVGGRAEDVERARAVLENLTRAIRHLGANGNGYAMKLAVNLGLGAYIQAIAESLALGGRYGMTIDEMLDVLQEAPYASGWLRSKIGVLKGDIPEKTLDIQTLRKDVMSAVATGALAGVPMPLSSGVLASLSAAVGQGYGENDLAQLPLFVRSAMLQDVVCSVTSDSREQ